MPEPKFIKAFLINDKVNSKEWKLSPELAAKYVSPCITKVDENNEFIDWKPLHLVANLDKKEFN